VDDLEARKVRRRALRLDLAPERALVTDQDDARPAPDPHERGADRLGRRMVAAHAVDRDRLHLIRLGQRRLVVVPQRYGIQAVSHVTCDGIRRAN